MITTKRSRTQYMRDYHRAHPATMVWGARAEEYSCDKCHGVIYGESHSLCSKCLVKWSKFAQLHKEIDPKKLYGAFLKIKGWDYVEVQFT